jgi:Uma2 family endonuclease
MTSEFANMSSVRDVREDVIFPPSDLLSDEPQSETYLHLQQMILLLKCLEWWWRDRQDFFAAGNLTIY